MSRSLGMPMPLSDMDRMKVVLLKPSFLHSPFSFLKSLILISPLSLPEKAYLKEFETISVTIQPPPNQLANIDFDVIGTSDY